MKNHIFKSLSTFRDNVRDVYTAKQIIIRIIYNIIITWDYVIRYRWRNQSNLWFCCITIICHTWVKLETSAREYDARTYGAMIYYHTISLPLYSEARWRHTRRRRDFLCADWCENQIAISVWFRTRIPMESCEYRQSTRYNISTDIYCVIVSVLFVRTINISLI